MNPPFEQVYIRTGSSRARSVGFVWSNKDSCRAYFGGRVAARLKLSDGTAFLQSYLERMPDTGFSLTRLRTEATQARQPRDWEVGEAFTEAVLQDHFECLFPWPTARDQREKDGHATGPDLPGYHLPAKSSARFAFGEVKSTGQQRSPPAVVAGVDGNAGKDTLVGQLRRLLTEPTRRLNLVAWLAFRETQDTAGTPRFDAALKQYGVTGDCLVVGCLVSGKRDPVEADLTDAQKTLEGHVADRELWLLAFYLPFEKADWPTLVAYKGGSA